MKAVKRKSGGGDALAKKKKDDTEAPKKPTGGGYGCYLAKHREALTKECEGKPVTAVTKLAGERWKALTPEEKRPFEEEYEAKKAAYQEAMKDYTPPANPTEEQEKAQSHKEKVTPRKPQKSKPSKEKETPQKLES